MATLPTVTKIRHNLQQTPVHLLLTDQILTHTQSPKSIHFCCYVVIVDSEKPHFNSRIAHSKPKTHLTIDNIVGLQIAVINFQSRRIHYELLLLRFRKVNSKHVCGELYFKSKKKICLHFNTLKVCRTSEKALTGI